MDGQRGDLGEEQLIADGLRVVGVAQPGGELRECRAAVGLPRCAELLGRDARGLRDEREAVIAVRDGVADGDDGVRVEHGLQARDELAVGGLDGRADGLAELQHAGSEVVGRVGRFLDGGFLVTAPTRGGDHEERGEDGRGQREPDVHGASRGGGAHRS